MTDEGNIFIVKRLLKTVVKKEVIELISKQERALRTVNFDVYALLTTIVLRFLQDGHPLPKIDQTFLSNLHKSAMLRGDNALPILIISQENESKVIRDAHTQWLVARQKSNMPFVKSTELLSNVINYNCREMLTAISNLVTTTTYKRHLIYVRSWIIKNIKVDNMMGNIQFRQSKSQSKMRSATISSLAKFITHEVLSVSHSPNAYVNDWNQLDSTILEGCKQFVEDLRARASTDNFDNFNAWLPYLYFLSNSAESVNRKPFPILPQCRSYSRVFVRIDTTAAATLLLNSGIISREEFNRLTKTTDDEKELKKAHKEWLSRKRQWDECFMEAIQTKRQKLESNMEREFRDIREYDIGEEPTRPVSHNTATKPEIWNLIFKEGLPKCNAGTFAFSLQTNGFDVSLKMKRLRERSKEKIPGSDVLVSLGKLPKQVDRVIAVDPGRRDLVTAVDFDLTNEVDKKPVRTLSNRQYAEISGQRFETYQMEKRKTDAIRSIISNMPSRRTANYDEYVTALEGVYAKSDPLWALFSHDDPKKDVTAQSRFRRYQKKQRSVSQIAKTVLGVTSLKKEDIARFQGNTVIAWGDASFGCQKIKGHASAPCGKAQRKMLEVCLKNRDICVLRVDERMTSKRCSGCGRCQCGELLENMTRKVNGQHVKVHSVQRCKNVKCDARMWNRDVNAGRNIGLKAIDWVRNQLNLHYDNLHSHSTV